jgi:two-component system, OmpR family, sensor histidine kinase MtrB
MVRAPAHGVPHALVSTRLVGHAGHVPDTVPTALTRRRRWLPLGLRARVTVGFSLLGLIVSFGLAIVTYTFARNYLLDQRDASAKTVAFANARLVVNALVAAPDFNQKSLPAGRSFGDGSFLHYQNRWFGNSNLARETLPTSLVDGVLAGSSGLQHYEIDGRPYVVVGIHLENVDADYFEAVNAVDLDRSLNIIGTTLGVGATSTTLVAAGFGLWASRRLLRPLSRVADAAGDLASGGLDTRLDEETDPDLNQLARSFNNMADAVQSRIEREARFASDVSHELRSPLTALTAAVEVLDARKHELPERSQQALEVVVTQIRRFDQMVLDLLEISRLDAGAADLHTEPVLLGPFVSRVAGRYGFGHLPVVTDPALVERPVPVDRRRLERILANLLGNAEHHAGGPVRITIAATTRGSGHDDAVNGHALNGHPAQRNRVQIAVEDAGPGVAAAERDRIFERFARGTAARHRVGTGLGLALVAEHARLQGGEAWVEDRPGGGARFVVDLPVGES